MMQQMERAQICFSLTNHAYWNLDGVLNPAEGQDQDQGIIRKEEAVVMNHCSVEDHTLWLCTSRLVELGTLHPIPTERILDLNMGKRLGPELDQIPGGYGYDHVYTLDPPCSSSSTPKQVSVSEIGIQGYLPSIAHVATLTISEPALVVYAGS
ncbi:MAG: hypothetical protein J3Q66DRAFT_428552 [Benniella sp.]|nr:MAG: hypothetical protein J3Q66DRAFT_428552 [Benniella sp.]